MKRLFKKQTAVLLAVCMLLSAFAASAGAAQTPEKSEASANKYGLTANISDGAILHTWCWSFNTIKENLNSIAEAGFSAIQTSPINEVVVGENGGMQLYGNGKWYYQYQPTNYKIGNYQLGTLDEFKAMCSEAHKLGLKVIVDAVVNHCASDFNAISDDVKNIPGEAFHPRVEIESWSNRYQVTQGKLTGLYDLNTQNPNVQQVILNYLKECLAAGADGFRFDAAKHIELNDDAPVDGHNFAGDFWNVILNNGAEFQYGEVLQGDGERIEAYAKLMNVTASNYGKNLRAELEAGTLKLKAAGNFAVNDVDKSKLVTWVESHDNYADGSYKTISNQMVKYGWAVIGAGGDTTPLFFSRPNNSTASKPWGDNVIGARGDGNYMSAEVAAVNHFRNALVGEPVRRLNLKDSSGKTNTSVLMVQRGTKGAVIINSSPNDFIVDNSTTVADGTYTDEVSGTTFTVSGGRMSGRVKAGSIAVIYDKPEPEQGYTVGDVNGDGSVNGSDAAILSRYTSGWEGYESRIVNMDAADINRDGKVNGMDAALLSRYTSGWDGYDKYIIFIAV